MTQTGDYSLENGPDGMVMSLSGAWVISSVGPLDRRLRAAAPKPAIINLAGVEDIDTAGAWVVWRLARDTGASFTGQTERAARLISAVRPCTGTADIAPKQCALPRRAANIVGRNVVETAKGFVSVLGFLGFLVVTLGATLRKPAKLRTTALFCQIEAVGIDSLTIIGLMSFLVGIVIAQQGAVQLRQFGAEIYTVNLTGRLAFRELGILMTAIMVAGRSGSAFAAQLGTMKLTEEIDAMRTIGVAPMEALVLPRVLAAVLMMPLLGIYASLLAVVGGATISAVTLDIPFWNFLARMEDAVPTYDLWVGLIKGPVFGLIIGLTGCYQGMLVAGNSEDVGKRTTLAVVQGIFAVIVIDAFFAVFFSEVGWK
jgi:phospholipid/cholesterol/gamma-HCH transport system permease protein